LFLSRYNRAILATTQSTLVVFCFTKLTSLDNTDLKQRVLPEPRVRALENII
jgi:hypothetical protein